MPLFSTHEKLYFVFARERDRFFLDSMLQPDTTTYLWMELRESKYDRIFFLGHANGKYTVRAIDDNSRRGYNDYHHYLISRNPGMQPGSDTVQIDAGPLKRWINDVLQKTSNRPTAVIFSLETFVILYSGDKGKQYLDKLIEHSRNGNSVLFLLPMELREEQQKLLTDRFGVFTHKAPSGRALCEELRDLLLSDEPVRLLEALKKRLGGNFIELGAVTYARLQSLMRCVRFRKRENWPDDQLLKYTNCLYNWWYLSDIPQRLPPAFRNMWAQLFFRERQREDVYAALYESLCSESGWDAFIERVGKISKDLAPAFLYSLNRQEVEERCHVTVASPVLLAIARIQWPEELLPVRIKDLAISPTVSIPLQAEWEAMRSSLPAPFNKPLLGDRLRSMEKYHAHFTRAKKWGDWDTLCRSMNAMLYGGKYLYSDSDSGDFDYDLRFEQYEKYLNASRSLFEIRSDLQRIQYDLSSASTLESGWYLAHLKNANSCDKLLKTMDAYLKFSPQLAKKVDTNQMQSMISELEQATDQNSQAAAPLYADDLGMSAEEADAILREKYLNRH